MKLLSPTPLLMLALTAIVLSFGLGYMIAHDEHMQHDYQIELHMDTTWLYDGQRLVGINIDSTYSGKGLFNLITKDNE